MRLLTLFFLLLSGLLYAQPDFTRYYDYGGTDRFAEVIQLSDTLLVAVGTSQSAAGLSRAILSVLDTAGETRRSLTIDYPQRTIGTALARQTDTTFWMSAWQTPTGIIDDWVVYRINALTGAAEGFGWGRPETDEQIRAMAPTPGGGVIVVGNTGDQNEAIFSRLDAEGNELFRRTFTIPGNRFTVGTDVDMLPGGDIIVSGQYDPNDGPEGQDAGFFLVRLTGAGELVWSRRYNLQAGFNISRTVKVVPLPDGRLAVTGTRQVNARSNTFLAYFDGSGNPEQPLRLTFGSFDRSSEMVLSPNNMLVIAGVRTSADREIGVIIRTSLSNPDTLIGNDLGFGPANRFSSVILRPRGGYLFTGSSVCGADALLISVDENLRDTVASCFFSGGSALWDRLTLSSTTAGELNPRTDPRFAPPALQSTGERNFNQYCAKVALAPADLPDPICYHQPIRLLDTARQISPDGSIVRMIISLGGGAGAGEGLLIRNVPDSVTISGNGTDVIRLDLTGEETGASLTTLLSGVQYFTDESFISPVERSLFVNVASNCHQGRGVQAVVFTVATTSPTFFPLVTTDTVICTDQSLSLCAPAQPDLTYTWSTGDTTACTTITQPGSFSLIRTAACAADTAIVTVATTDEVPLATEQTVEVICLGDSLIVAPFLPMGVSAAWSDSFPNLARNIRTAGLYNLQRSNVCGVALTTFDVRTTDCCQLYLPTAFSPNGDGINDRFRAFPDTDRCRLISNYQLTIYNRWGGVVYTTSILTNGWSGQVDGKPSETGYYVYAISYFNGLEAIERSGGFTLVR